MRIGSEEEYVDVRVFASSLETHVQRIHVHGEEMLVNIGLHASIHLRGFEFLLFKILHANYYIAAP
jgi:hypothetical protein